MVRQASSRVRQFLAELEVGRFAERQVVVSCQITKSAKVIRILEVDAKVVFLVISGHVDPDLFSVRTAVALSYSSLGVSQGVASLSAEVFHCTTPAKGDLSLRLT